MFYKLYLKKQHFGKYTKRQQFEAGKNRILLNILLFSIRTCVILFGLGEERVIH